MAARISSLADLGKGAWKVSGASPKAAALSPRKAQAPTVPITTPALEAAAPKARKPRKNEIEGEEQALLVKEFRLRNPAIGPLLIHIPNGGSRKNAFEGWRLKEQGVRKGVSDLLLPIARGGFFGLWIEFKATPPNDAPVSDEQEEWLALMQAQGYHGEVCLGIDAALDALNRYLALPPTTVLKAA